MAVLFSLIFFLGCWNPNQSLWTQKTVLDRCLLTCDCTTSGTCYWVVFSFFPSLSFFLSFFRGWRIDWCCFYYFLRNSLVALLEALFARPDLGRTLHYRFAYPNFDWLIHFSYSSWSNQYYPMPNASTIYLGNPNKLTLTISNDPNKSTLTSPRVLQTFFSTIRVGKTGKTEVGTEVGDRINFCFVFLARRHSGN